MAVQARPGAEVTSRAQGSSSKVSAQAAQYVVDSSSYEQAEQHAAPQAMQPRWLNENSTSVPQRH